MSSSRVVDGPVQSGSSRARHSATSCAVSSASRSVSVRHEPSDVAWRQAACAFRSSRIYRVEGGKEKTGGGQA